MKKFFIYVIACLVLCNCVLADFEDIASDSVSDSEPVEEGVTPDEAQVPLEKIDEVVSVLPDLAAASVSEFTDSGVAPEVSPGGNTIYVLNQPSDSSESEVVSDAGAASSDPVLTDVSMLTGLAPVTPSDATGLKAVLLGFIGNYDPPIVQFEYTTNNNYKQYVNEIQPDYVWICSFALIALFIYCLFKLGGALIRG